MFTVSYNSLPNLDKTLDKVINHIEKGLLPKVTSEYHVQRNRHIKAMNNDLIPKLKDLVRKRNTNSFLYLLQRQTIDNLIDDITDSLKFQSYSVTVQEAVCLVDWKDYNYTKAVNVYRKLTSDLTTFKSIRGKVNRFIALTHSEGITGSSVSFSNNNALKINEYLEALS